MSQSTKNTNKTNYQIAQETNQTNYDIAQMSNDYNAAMLDKQIEEQWKMWNAENAYNDPSAQRERLEAAGLNPYLMMSGGDAGTAGSMTAPSAQPAVSATMQAPVMQADPPLAKVLGALDGLQNILDSFQGGQQLRRGALDYDTAKKSQLGTLKLLNANADIAEIGRNYEKMFKDLQAVGMGYQNQILFQQSKQAAYDTVGKQLETYYKEPLLLNQVLNGMAAIRLQYQQGQINDKQLDKLSAEIAGIRESTRGVRIQNDINEASKDDELRKRTAEANSAESNQGANNEAQLIQDIIRNFAKSKDPWTMRYKDFRSLFDSNVQGVQNYSDGRVVGSGF